MNTARESVRPRGSAALRILTGAALGLLVACGSIVAASAAEITD